MLVERLIIVTRFSRLFCPTRKKLPFVVEHIKVLGGWNLLASQRMRQRVYSLKRKACVDEFSSNRVEAKY